MTTADLAPAVDLEIAHFRAFYGDDAVVVSPDGSGGARIIIERIPLSGTRLQEDTWVGFYLTYVHPSADIYPFYVRHDLFRDGTSPTPPLNPGQHFLDRSALMLSRSTPRHRPRPDVAFLKLQKIVDWLRTIA